ncbi:MAG TPA: peptidoglycan DD-metalloendopeptidase family protein [Gaiellaceae bacterium]|nr:peptidoglycan DD-metalloendopeptidase family protein [Gaiellaceae bacterium]
MRRLALAVLVLLAVATPALGDDVAKKQHVDQRIAALNGDLARQRQREQALRGEVDAYTARIRALEARVGDVSLKLGTLQADLSLHRKRLDALDELYGLQTGRYRYLQQQYRLAVRTLERRFVQLYESDPTTTLDVVLGARNLQDAVDEVEYLRAIGAQDRRIADAVGAARRRVRAARARTAHLRATVRGETAVIAARTAQVQSVRDELVGAQSDLAAQRQTKLVDLSQLTASERAEASEIDALQAASAALTARIRAAQASSSGGPTAAPSSAGLIWPVSGPITSPFGWRWGRMHQGIDIGVPYGTPIHAAAAGTVIYCGWEEGYGNLVVIDHGGNLATAYGHQSAIAVTCGQVVQQGDVIGYVGCTGHCTGPHLHFEVRVDGNPVDPLGYLP